MEFKPLNNRVVLKKIETDTTKSGIVLLQKEQSSVSLVVAVADNIKDIKAGDYVIQAKYAGSDIEENGEKFTILDVRDILGVVEGFNE